MSGTREGGLKAAATNKERYDKLYEADGGFYGHLGKLGGAAAKTGGFAAHPELASDAGRKGGSVSKRRPTIHEQEESK